MPARLFTASWMRFVSLAVVIFPFSYGTRAAGCVQSSQTAWENQSISTETAPFTASFDATPNQADIDGVMGFSSGTATAYTSLAAIVRFNQNGAIDVRNGNAYTADQSVPYSAGLTYHIQMAIDPSNHTYTVYVTPPGGSPITLASNYAFRSEQANTSSLDNWALYVDVGYESICNLTIGSGSNTRSPQINLNPTSVAFGNVNLGSSSSKTVTLTNTGSATLNITAATISGADYATTLKPTSLNAGANTTFTVTFTPTASGNASGSISITSNSPDSPTTIALSGTGLQAQIAATPSTVAFGTVTEGTTDSVPITLTNGMNTTLTFSQISVTGAGFAQTGLTTSTTIPAGGSTTFNATFDPTSATTVNGSITLTTNGTPSPLVISLSGTGQASTLLLGANPTTLAFGNVLDQNSSQLTTAVTNNGNSNVTISSITINGAGFNESGIVSGTVLTPGQSAPLTVTFAPTSGGAVSGSVSIRSNATNSPATVSLSGTGMHSVVLTWDASPTGGVTYNVYRGTTSGGETTTPINTAAITTLTFTDTNVTPGTTYYYTVEAVDSGGSSAPSNEATAAIPNP